MVWRVTSIIFSMAYNSMLVKCVWIDHSRTRRRHPDGDWMPSAHFVGLVIIPYPNWNVKSLVPTFGTYFYRLSIP